MAEDFVDYGQEEATLYGSDRIYSVNKRFIGDEKET
jgi:hypothetical protein